MYTLYVKNKIVVVLNYVDIVSASVKESIDFKFLLEKAVARSSTWSKCSTTIRS